jgi:asparagine synthase (glutamine-hydrolysing)
MPVWNEKKDLVLIFFGENFTDPELFDQLKINHKFDNSNASYLIHLYEEKGIDFLRDLNGWFSGILIDLQRRKIILFNDRYGLGRIYFHENKEAFYFASEAKALLKILPNLRQLDFRSMAETLSCGCVLQNRTLFSEIKLLPGGSKWVFNGASISQKESFFDPAQWENQELLDSEAYYEKLKDTFTCILPRYFQSKHRIGMSLTGGLDGRMIMASANLKPGALTCYTFGSTYNVCRDVKIARQVAELCHQSHTTIVAGPELLSEFPHLAEKAIYCSDGSMNISGAVEVFVNIIARQIAPIRLTGNYGSEIVRGNVAFGPSSNTTNLFTSEIQALIQAAAATYSHEAKCHKVTFIAFKQVPWHHYSRFAVEQSQLTMRSPYLDNDLVSLMYQAPIDLLTSKTPSLRLIAEGNSDLARIPTDRGLLYKPVPLVTKLQHFYAEFTSKAEYAYDYGMPQWLAHIDYLLNFMHFEHLFLGQHKFYHFKVWYRDALAEYVKAILLDERTLSRPYLNRKVLEYIVDSHTKGYRNYTTEITHMLTLELIQRLLIEQK